jgi:hypothetical protein
MKRSPKNLFAYWRSSSLLSMESRNIALSLVFILCFSFSHAQNGIIDNKYAIIDSYQVKANSISVDNFGNFYAVGDNQILKFDRNGVFQVRFEEVKNGKIGSVDVTNPFKLLIYYPDFMNAVIVDKFLTYVTSYNFFDLGYQSVTAVGSSADGYLWFYDATDYTLKKIDATGNVQLKSQPVNQLIDKIINPNFIQEKNGQVFVNDTATGILVFDNFGAYYKTIPIFGLQKFHILQEQIVYYQDNKLRSYNPVTFDAKMISLPDTLGVIEAAIDKERIAILKSDRIDFYRYR